MRPIILLLFVVLLVSSIGYSGCTRKMDQNIKEKTSLGLDTLTKAKDRGQEGALIANLNGDPVLHFYYTKGYFKGSVSHGVVTLTGKLRTEEQRDLAEDLAKAVKGVKEVINEIVVDPDMEESPIDDIW